MMRLCHDGCDLPLDHTGICRGDGHPLGVEIVQDAPLSPVGALHEIRRLVSGLLLLSREGIAADPGHIAISLERIAEIAEEASS